MCDKRVSVPLDNKNLCYLSAFTGSDGTSINYSIDIEAADDEHYQINASDAVKLEKFLQKEMGACDLPSGLRAFISEHGFWKLDTLFIQAEVNPSHFCYYTIE